MNADIRILPATVEDIDAIQELENSSFGGDAFSRRQLRYLLTRAKGAAFAARQGDKLVGYVSILVSGRYHGGRLYSLAVDSACRGQGIAGALIDRAIAFVEAKGLAALFLEVRVDNAAAISLYLKKGFRRRGVKAAYYHDGQDACSMVLPLSCKRHGTVAV